MKRLAGLGLILVLLLTGAACDSGAGEASLQQAVDNAITKTSEALSYRSSGNATWREDDLVCRESWESEYSGSESWRQSDTVTCDGDGSANATWMDRIVAGGAAYMRSSSHPEWQVLVPLFPTAEPPTADPTVTSSFVAAPTSMATTTPDKEWAPFRYLVDLERMPDEEIGGVKCSHVRGRVDQDAFVDMLTQRQEDLYGEVPEDMSEALELTRRQSFEVELWISEDDYVRQRTIGFHFPKPDYSSGEETWVAGSSATRYYDFNEAITIEPPEIDAE